jgi:phosphoserine phosphatase
MDSTAQPSGLTPEKLRWILEVTRKLAAPFDLNDLLHEVVDAAKVVLDADGATVWLYDAATDELVLRAARGLEPIRIHADLGIVGASFRTRQLSNVPDCYADPRFNREVDRASGYRTRCMLTLPLLGNDDAMVGAMQVVNRRSGVFDVNDEVVASALAAQCAVALQRAQMTERLVQAEKLRQEISVAREIQMGTLPKVPPKVAGYDVAGTFRPTDETGGDTYDFVPTPDGRLMMLMGDATGHGIGPALSVTQVHAMLRVAQRFGASLDETFRHINNQLAKDLPEDRFVTAFLGLLDPVGHELRYHSGGQGPLLHYHAADGSCEFLPPTTFPLGTMALTTTKPAKLQELHPGDIFALISDGVYEYQDAQGNQFGERGVAEVLARHGGRPMADLLRLVLDGLDAFGQGAPQLDDITMVLIRRLPPQPAVAADEAAAPGSHTAQQTFPRNLEALAPIFEFIQHFIEAEALGADERYAMGFTVEELFTNVLKYTVGGSGDIELRLERVEGELIGTLIDPDCEPFDVTKAPDFDIKMPADLRRTGGLGIHLIRRVVDSIEYDYTGRRSRITFKKKLELG